MDDSLSLRSPPPADRLSRVRSVMKHLGLDALVVRGTDPYLNEYVPLAESTRAWLTGFTGSLGDALVTHDGAWVFVDGRYHVQVDREVDPGCFTPVKNALGTSNETACSEKLQGLALEGDRPLAVGFEPERWSVNAWESFTKSLLGLPIQYVGASPSPVETARGEAPRFVVESCRMRVVDEATLGRTVAEKCTDALEGVAKKRADGLLVAKLDELAWITNLRGVEMPYQATFRGIGAVTSEGLWVSVHALEVTDALRAERPGVRFVSDEGVFEALRRAGGGSRTARVALDPASTSVALRDRVASLPAEVVPMTSPLSAPKAKKNPAELDAMRRAFASADGVVAEATRWLLARVAEGQTLTERDFARQVEVMFLAAGAVGLSFKVISAFGPNGAVVHHPPGDTVLRAGELLLLDTGCYFEEGYATDLTRTFFVGGPEHSPTEDQRRMYTLVLKSAIAGMTARFPRGANGAQLDGITRAPLWSAGVDYAHGTGHGVGINVHEAPPGVSKLSTAAIEEGQVFSIEPGLYTEGVGGVRIENLCTSVPDPEHEGFLRVEPMTFSPLDPRLIDDERLDEAERRFLADFALRGAAYTHCTTKMTPCEGVG